MGFLLPPIVPQIVVQNRTYGVSAFLFNDPIGPQWMVGIFELTGQGWQFVAPGNTVAVYYTQDEMPADVKAKGGRVAYLKWVIAQINAVLTKMFVIPPPPTTEPTTSDEAIAQVSAAFVGMHLVLVNGVPQLV